jgi:hypothetical protein
MTRFSSANFIPSGQCIGRRSSVHRVTKLPSGLDPPGVFEAPKRASRRRTPRGWHLPPPTTAADSLARGFPDSPNCTSRARLRWPTLQRMGSSLRSRAVIRLATFIVLGRHAVDAANRASKPAPRTITTGATSSRGGWADAAYEITNRIVPGGVTRSRTSLVSLLRTTRGAHCPSTRNANAPRQRNTEIPNHDTWNRRPIQCAMRRIEGFNAEPGRTRTP